MPRPRTLEPKYCLHRPSGHAFVILAGERKHVGDFGTPGGTQDDLPRCLAGENAAPLDDMGGIYGY